MTTLLHIDASARPGRSDQNTFGSHTRRLGACFTEHWRTVRPQDPILYRDVGQRPPQPVTGEWIHAAFTKPDQRTFWMEAVLAESDRLVDEVIAADIIVVGVPMYNFNVPAQFKAYIDNIVRVGRTFGFDRSRAGAPYWPMLAEMDKTLVILSSRGDHGYGLGEHLEAMNHVEPSIRTAFAYIGVTETRCLAAEFDEFADDRLEASLRAAEGAVADLARALAETRS